MTEQDIKIKELTERVDALERLEQLNGKTTELLIGVVEQLETKITGKSK